MNDKPTVDVKTLPVITRFIYTIGQLPTSYMMSMTYEEQVVWLCNYLEKEIIPALNQNGQAVEELQNLYELLREYVNSYFENLDVQEEINNKLDEMTRDGSLTQIIKNYIDPFIIEQNNRINQIDAKVDAVTNGNPIPVSSISDMTDTTKIYVLTTDGYWYYYNGTDWVQGAVYQGIVYETDKSLSIEDTPADAYYTGIVKNHEEYVFDKVLNSTSLEVESTSEDHAIGTSGSVTTTDAEGKNINYYNVTNLREKTVKIITETTRAVKYAFYRGSTQSPSTMIKVVQKADGLLDTVPSNATYLLVVYDDNSPIVQTITNNFIDNNEYQNGTLSQEIQILNNDLYKTISLTPLRVSDGYSIRTDGRTQTDENNSAYVYEVTQYQGQKIYVESSTNQTVKIAWYKGTQINATNFIGYSNETNTYFTIPSNAVILIIVNGRYLTSPVSNVIQKNYLTKDDSEMIEKIKPDYIANNIKFVCHQGLTKNSIHANTLKAFYQAFQYGYNAIETDIRATLDNVLVISHDDTITDTNNVSYNISEITYAQLESLEMTYEIPTLQNVLHVINACDLKDSILELKSNSTTVASLASQMVQDMRLEDKVFFNIRGNSSLLNALYVTGYRKVNFLTRYVNYETALSYQSNLANGRVMFSIISGEYGTVITETEFNNLKNLGFEFTMVASTNDDVYQYMNLNNHISINDSIKNNLNLTSVINDYINTL